MTGQALRVVSNNFGDSGEMRRMMRKGILACATGECEARESARRKKIFFFAARALVVVRIGKLERLLCMPRDLNTQEEE